MNKARSRKSLMTPVDISGELVHLLNSRKEVGQSVSEPNVESGELCTSKGHHFGLFGFGLLHWDVNVLIVCTHVVGQPGKCH